MDLQKCQVFMKVAQLGNLTKAAEELGYTQPGVSLIIKKIEEECGFSLFSRSRKGVQLTPDGSRMLPIIREITKWNEMYHETADSVKGIEKGTIRIGTYSSIGLHWLPKIIRRFRADYPQVDINVYEGGVQQISEWIHEGFVDIGFLSTQAGQTFDVIELKEEPILAILPPDHPMKDLATFPLSALSDPAFILSLMSYDNDCYKVFEEYQRRYGATLKVKLSSASAPLILAMVENGLGISVLAESMAQGYADRLVTKKIEPEFKRMIAIGVSALSEISPATGEFISYTKTFVQDLGK